MGAEFFTALILGGLAVYGSLRLGDWYQSYKKDKMAVRMAIRDDWSKFKDEPEGDRHG